MLQILFQRYLSPALSPARSFSYIWLSSQLWVSRCSVYIHINVDLIHEIAFVPPPPPPLPHTQCHGSGTVTFWWWSKRSHYTSLCWVRVGNFTNVSTPSSLYVHILLLWASAQPVLLTARIRDLAFRVCGFHYRKKYGSSVAHKPWKHRFKLPEAFAQTSAPHFLNGWTRPEQIHEMVH